MVSITRFNADKVEISGNIATKRWYLDFIADSRQLMTRAVRNTGASESDESDSSEDSAVMALHRAPIDVSRPFDETIKFSISLIRAKTSSFFSLEITE